MTKKKYAILTMDVESFSDTECVAHSPEVKDIDLLDGFDEFIKILDKHNIKGTLFTVGSLAPKMVDRLKSCIKNGHELALHNYTHTAPIEINSKTFENNILKAKQELSDLFDTDITGFRAPYFSMDSKRLSIIKKSGFRYDSSFLDFSKARHTVKLDLNGFKEVSKNIYRDNDFFEFGLPLYKTLGVSYPISGGGYMRLSNWTLIKLAVKQYLRKNDFYVFYLHPFELTTQKVPVLKELTLYNKYYLTYGIKSYGRHIEQLISILKKSGFEFITFDELSKKLIKEKDI